MKTQTLIRNIAMAILVIGSLVSVVTAHADSLSGPFTHKNLTVFLVHGEDGVKGRNFITLQEAMKKKSIIVHETGDVNELTIENISPNEEVFIQAGDIVKGGRQDRTFGYDLILSPKSGKIPIPSFCVEHGRWSQRGGESAQEFHASADQLVTKDLKLAAKSKGDQGDVWKKVAEAQEKLEKNVGSPVKSNVSESSLQLTIENRTVQQTIDGYIKALSNVVDGQKDVIGYAFAINGKVNSADLYNSHNLFIKLWPKLLKASAVEALTELQPKSQKELKLSAVTAEEIQNAFVDAEKGQREEKTVTPRTSVSKQETDKNVLFTTHDRELNTWVHKNYITK